MLEDDQFVTHTNESHRDFKRLPVNFTEQIRERSAIKSRVFFHCMNYRLNNPPNQSSMAFQTLAVLDVAIDVDTHIFIEAFNMYPVGQI